MSSFRLTQEDLAKLQRIREALAEQVPASFRPVTATDALRFALDGTAKAHSVSVDIPARRAKPPSTA